MGRLVTGDFLISPNQLDANHKLADRLVGQHQTEHDGVYRLNVPLKGRLDGEGHRGFFPHSGNGDAFDLSTQGSEWDTRWWGGGTSPVVVKRRRHLVKWNPSMLKLTGLSTPLHSNATDSGACRSLPPKKQVLSSEDASSGRRLRRRPTTSRVFQLRITADIISGGPWGRKQGGGGINMLG